MSERFFANPEAILGTLAQLFSANGEAREVAILAHGSPELEHTDTQATTGGWESYYTLHLNVPLVLYTAVEASSEEIEKKILERIQNVLKRHTHDFITSVSINPSVVDDPQWREKAVSWLSGSHVTNQGRVRSNNVAPLSVDGLLFRSQPEINLYRALKNLGVSFAPLPVFIRGGESYQRIEPDFVVIKNGLAMVVEVDGDTVHQETPAEAHARTVMLSHEGVHIERVLASECDSQQKAKNSANRLIKIIEKLKRNR
ncbi:MAG: hypothetical protein O7F12_02975 [Nitrospirae bacterium]|nr:hypothetical protein [Nitrospirota bacterium]